MGEFLALLKNEEKNSSAIRTEKYALVLAVVVLIALTIIMMFDIKRLQGTARVINYAGIVRGATQRLVKLEMNGYPNLVLEDNTNNIIFGLRTGSESLYLVQIDDPEYRRVLDDTITTWNMIRGLLVDERLHSGERDELMALSEQHFSLADQMVSLAEVYSQKIASRIEKIEFGITVCLLFITVVLVHWALRIIISFSRNKDFKQKDSVSGLYKKNYFYNHIDEERQSHPGQSYTGFCSYIEHYNALSERYSYQKLSAMLQELAEILSSHVPDCVVGGRLTTETYAFFLKEQPDSRWLDELQTAVEQDFCYPVSIKYSVYDAGAPQVSASKMCDRMMMSLEQIKGRFGDNVVHYDEAMLEQARRKNAILESMKEALKQGQFKAYFQPKHSLHTDTTGGAEVLVRWIHPEMGFMNPGEFIPLFEKNGFISNVDFYIWEEACKALRKWKDEGRTVVPLSVNMSRKDFEVPGIVERIITMTDKYRLERNLLHFEVTESSYTEHTATMAGVVAALHAAGYVIELDDFGSGYSSMTTLNELTLDVLKLDMSLVRQDNPYSENSILKFAITLGKMTGLQVVAEGVETEAQVARLRELGGDYIQGYFYSRPLPQEEFEAYLEKERA